MQQYFIDRPLTEGDLVRLDDEVAFHLTKVLHSREGDPVRLVDGEGRAFLCRLEMTRKEVHARVETGLAEKRETEIEIFLAQARIKKDKWEWLLQKATELGVRAIIPVLSSRTVVREFHNEEKMQERFEKILTEAAEQAERHRVPMLHDPVKLEEADKIPGDLRLVCYERSEGFSLSLVDRISALAEEEIRSVTILVGPEGGFEEEELDRLVEAGFECVNLGPRILRAETAAILAVGLAAQILK